MTDPDLPHLTEITEADVYKAGQRAATLRRTPHGIEFSYRPEYLSTSNVPVATTLPVTDEPLTTPAGAVPPFFAGLLPEGRRLSSLRRAVKTSADDELSLLLAVGQDTVGDVQVVPSNVDLKPPDPAVQVDRRWSEVRLVDVLDAAGIDRIGIPGIQDKVSARMISVPIARAGERFILKVDPPEYPHVVENEAYFLRLAGTARIQSVTAEVVHDADGRPALLVQRFDRLPQPDGSTHALACEDACQVLGRWPADKYAMSAEAAVTALADVCAARPVALRSLFRQICFAWLTGNGDVHAKNLSVLATPQGEWRVAPAYDLPSTVPYGDKTLALSIGGKRAGISRQQLLAFASGIGLPERAARDALDQIVVALEDLEQSLRDGALPFDSNTTIELVKELRHRRRLAAS